MALERWEVDSGHSGIHLSARHMMVARVRGRFSRWSGTILTDPEDLRKTRLEVYIDATSIETGCLDRDAHLKSADFLDVARYPEITFSATRVGKVRGKRLRVAGELGLHGVRSEVALDVEFLGRTTDPWGRERAGFTAKASLDRRDFGLAWNRALEAGGILISDTIEVEIEVEAVRQEEPGRSSEATGGSGGYAPSQGPRESRQEAERPPRPQAGSRSRGPGRRPEEPPRTLEARRAKGRSIDRKRITRRRER